ncbi:MAG: hypothetical protein ACFFAJ_01795 [Candidatus Hodarchaeota archaeon]
MEIAYAVRVEGLSDEYGHDLTGPEGRFVTMVDVAINPDFDMNTIFEQWEYRIDSVKVSMKIQRPNGNFLSHGDILGGDNDFYIAPEAEDESEIAEAFLNYIQERLYGWLGLTPELNLMTALEPPHSTKDENIHTADSRGWLLDYHVYYPPPPSPPIPPLHESPYGLGFEIHIHPDLHDLDTGIHRVYITIEIQVIRLGWIWFIDYFPIHDTAFTFTTNFAFSFEKLYES